MRTAVRTFQTSIRALKRNIMRSALTTLGIIIGIAAVIAMTEIGQGSSTAVRKTIQSMGANILLVQPGQAASGGGLHDERETAHLAWGQRGRAIATGHALAVGRATPARA